MWLGSLVAPDTLGDISCGAGGEDVTLAMWPAGEVQQTMQSTMSELMQ